VQQFKKHVFRFMKVAAEILSLAVLETAADFKLFKKNH
jgi:hypothetical protein